MSQFYVFEYGSASTWGKYILPVEAYRLYVCHKGSMHLGSVVPSSIEFSGVKNLRLIESCDLLVEVKKLQSSKETP